PAERGRLTTDISLRLTWQASQKHKITFSHLHDTACSCYDVAASYRPDGSRLSRQKFVLTQVGWTAPVTNRLLFDVRGSDLDDRITIVPGDEAGGVPETNPTLGLGARYMI